MTTFLEGGRPRAFSINSPMPGLLATPFFYPSSFQEHTAVVFAEEVRGLQEQLRQIKMLLQSSWCSGNGLLRLLGLGIRGASKRHQKYNPA